MWEETEHMRGRDRYCTLLNGWMSAQTVKGEKANEWSSKLRWGQSWHYSLWNWHSSWGQFTYQLEEMDRLREWIKTIEDKISANVTVWWKTRMTTWHCVGLQHSVHAFTGETPYYLMHGQDSYNPGETALAGLLLENTDLMRHLNELDERQKYDTRTTRKRKFLRRPST